MPNFTFIAFFTFVKTSFVAVVKTHKKITGRPRKDAAKKAKAKKNGLAAVDEFVRLAEKYNLDFNYVKE